MLLAVHFLIPFDCVVKVFYSLGAGSRINLCPKEREFFLSFYVWVNNVWGFFWHLHQFETCGTSFSSGFVAAKVKMLMFNLIIRFNISIRNGE